MTECNTYQHTCNYTHTAKLVYTKQHNNNITTSAVKSWGGPDEVYRCTYRTVVLGQVASLTQGKKTSPHKKKRKPRKEQQKKLWWGKTLTQKDTPHIIRFCLCSWSICPSIWVASRLSRGHLIHPPVARSCFRILAVVYSQQWPDQTTKPVQ